MIEKMLIKKGYFVSETGQAYSPKGDKIGFYHTNGYEVVGVRLANKVKKVFVHRLQAYQKYGDALYSSGMEVRHVNGDRTDNSHSNILIGSHSENMQDIPEQVRIIKARYAASFLKKYNNDDVILFYNNCKSYKKTMEHFNMTSKGTLHYILNSKLYKKNPR